MEAYEDRTIPLSRHAEIVRGIYTEFAQQQHLLNVILGVQHEDGHRYSGERCVWCGVNYLDHLVEEEPKPCPGPREGEWNDRMWPLTKMDALLKEHREVV